MKVNVYKQANGQLRINKPSHRRWNELLSEGKTEDEAIQSIKQVSESKDPSLLSDTFIGSFNESDLPTDREFRNQWRQNGSSVHVDPVLETAERWVRIRKERDKRLIESDGKYLKAQDMGGNVAAWKTYRQELRDVPTQPDPKNITWPTEPS